MRKKCMDDAILKSGTEEKVRKYCGRKNICSAIWTAIKNLVKVLIIRFPHITIPNVVMIYIVLKLYMKI